MDELLVIDKILDILVPVKLRGKRMGVLMERGVKIMFLVVVAVIAIERILRKTIEAIGDTNQWSYAIGCMMLYLFITIMIYALVMAGITMFISMISDMKRERVVEAKLDVQESDQNLVEGYADRLAKYFNTMVHLGIVDNNATAFARYFAEQCNAVSSDSYIRTFRNSKGRNLWDKESEGIIVNLMNS